MKTKAMSLILVTLMSLSSFAGEEITLPNISKPAALEEGTQRQLSAAQIAELIPWAKDSKMFLVDLIDSTQGLSIDDKIERLDFGIKQVVGESAPKHSELLMRYVLNRAIVIKDTLSREMNGEAVGTADAKLRTLIASINMAVKYYEVDMNTLSKKSTPDFYDFGATYFNFLSELNKSIFDASAQYAIQRTSLEWLQWDLYRDLNNTRHAPVIVKINNALKMIPAGKQSDFQSIKNIQQLKKISTQLTFINDKRPEISRPEVVVPSIVTDTNASRYGYSTYYAKCFPKSASGELMTSSQVDDDYCAKKDSYNYSTYYAKCYKVSHSGEVMMSSRVDDVKCAKRNSYNYSTYYNKCYMVSNAGDVMMSARVEDNMCAKPDSYTYSSYYAKCYKVSNAGDAMTSSVVDNSYCQSR